MKKGPFSAVVTNVAPNHLDIHKDMQEYIDAKRNIISYQSEDSRATLNFENDITRGFEKRTLRKMPFLQRRAQGGKRRILR